MIKKIVSVVQATVIVGCLLSAKTAWAQEHEFGVGLGPEYGGIYGFQYAYRADDSRYKFGLGVLGISVGTESRFDSSEYFSYGALAGYAEFWTADVAYAGATLHYYPMGFDSNSFVISAGLGVYHQTDTDVTYTWDSRIEVTTTSIGISPMISLGYKF